MKMKITLSEGIYEIPEELTIKILPGARRISVQKKKSKTIAPNDYRCKDCVHQFKGYCTRHRWYKSDVCELKPKRDIPDTFYAAPYNRKACEKFKLKRKQ